MHYNSDIEWSNHIGEYGHTPDRTFYPATWDEITNIITLAESFENNIKVRASGSGHSWSPVCPTPNFMIMPDKLRKELPLEPDTLNQNNNLTNLVRIQSGMRIRELNQLLDNRNKALKVLGGFDGQTIAGVCQTSTHGSVINAGPLYECILSYDVAGSGGKKYRIEPKNGITDVIRFQEKYPEVILVQDDDWYNAISVGIGTLGIIYSVIIEVTDAFYLKEEHKKSNWTDVKTMLKDKNIFTNNFAFELKLNPHPTLEKDYTCIITTRNKYVPKGDESKDAKRRNPFIQFLSRLNKNGELNKIFNTLKSSSPAFIDWALNSFVEDTYIDKSFKVFNIGEANYIPAYSSELAISMKADQYIEIIDKLLEHIEFIRKKNNWYMSGPLAIRFVRKANAWISPMYGEDTCMVEVIMAKGTLHAKKIYTSIEKEMDKYNVRMHWGQYNYQSSAMIQRKYPKIEKWKKVAAELNKTNVFTNNYINSVGLNS